VLKSVVNPVWQVWHGLIMVLLWSYLIDIQRQFIMYLTLLNVLKQYPLCSTCIVPQLLAYILNPQLHYRNDSKHLYLYSSRYHSHIPPRLQLYHYHNMVSHYLVNYMAIYWIGTHLLLNNNNVWIFNSSLLYEKYC
jgi:hypothetical protein